jgi:YNFM family putative membrane transporter
MENGKHISRGSGEYYRANLALFLAGFVTFSMLYTFQPLLPNLVDEFGVSPAVASLALSFATFALALALPLSGFLSDALGRRMLMGGAVVLAPLLALATVASDSLSTILGLRLLQGVVLAGIPAIAIAYMNEEMEPRAVGNAIGLYIAGNAFGGMAGRILTAWLADFMSWQSAIFAIALLCLGLGLLFLLLMPASRNFRPRQLHPRQFSRSLWCHLKNPALVCLFIVAFTCMGSFITLYNYVTFRLLGAEFELSQTQVALIFLAYAFGAFSSSLLGALTNRFERSQLLFSSLAIMAAGLVFTLLSNLAVVTGGIVLFTIGFFAAHTVASAWVGSLARHSRAQASSLYLFSYYLGSSVAGTAGGLFYSLWAWPGVALLILLLLGLAGLASLRLVMLGRNPGAAGRFVPLTECE